MTSAAGQGAGWERLARAAAQRQGASPPENRRELLGFRLGDAAYAIPVERVREIVRLRAVTPVPRVPLVIRGVISLRGEIVEVLDLRARLGLEPAPPSRATRIVVLHGDEGEVTGLLVDSVTEVLRVDDAAIQASPTGDSEFVCALCAKGDLFVSMLDLERVLDLG